MSVHDQSIIKINESLKLRPLTDKDYDQALIWYSNENILKYSENRSEPYDLEMIQRMYKYLSDQGEVYVIDYYEDGWLCIGDVTLSESCMPMIIMPDYQSK